MASEGYIIETLQTDTFWNKEKEIYKDFYESVACLTSEGLDLCTEHTILNGILKQLKKTTEKLNGLT